MRRSTLLRLVLATAVAGCVLIAPAAAAQAPDHFSAGDQYVETLPSTKGPKAADGKRGKGGGKHMRLAAPIEQKVRGEGGTQAAKLIEIATSPELGAPTKSTDAKKKHRNRGSRPAVPSAAIDAVGGGGTGIVWLVCALLFITAILLGSVGYQRYKNRDASG
jgi:hypothetical protein